MNRFCIHSRNLHFYISFHRCRPNKKLEKAVIRYSLRHIPKVSVIRVCRNRPRSQIQHEVNYALVVYVSTKCNLELVINPTPLQKLNPGYSSGLYALSVYTFVARYADVH